MEPYRADVLAFALNAVLIALILTAPLLVGLLVIRVLSQGVSEDRTAFEDEIRLKLGEITDVQADVKKQLGELFR